MSRLGKTPIAIPKGVEVKVEANKIHVKGPKGALSMDLPRGLEIKIEDSKLHVVWSEAIKMEKAFYGFYRASINNLIVGVSQGFQKTLKLIGVGYRAAVAGKNIDLQLGFSHPTQLPIPEGIKVEIDKSVSILISGIDKQKVGQFAATVRAARPPEPYKGKGVRYEDEYVRKKAGKSAKATK
jgi:large subunit ribosomal protein L6